MQSVTVQVRRESSRKKVHAVDHEHARVLPLQSGEDLCEPGIDTHSGGKRTQGDIAPTAQRLPEKKGNELEQSYHGNGSGG